MGEKKSAFGAIETIKGKYLYASSSETIKGEEVEVKVEIKPSQIKAIKQKLVSLGAVLGKKIKEKDIYFTAPHRDFIKTRECLRIREREDYLEMTYKGPTTKSMADKKQFWKSEINIPLNCSKEEAEIFLESINFTKIIDVIKEREEFILNKQKVFIDKVDGLGWFLEIENIAIGEKERQEAIDENMNLLINLNLSEKHIINEPYRDLVLKSLLLPKKT